MSERVSIISMPGSLRRAKQRVTGNDNMQNDPLEPKRLELTDLGEMLTTIETCGRTMQASIELLNSAPKVMLDKMRMFFPHDGPYAQLITRFSALDGQLGQRLESSQAHLESLKSLVSQVRDQCTPLAQQFKERDAAFSTSAHYDKKVDGLRQKLVRSSGNAPLVDKVNRNEQKRIEAAQALQQMSDDTERSASAVLARKLSDTGEAVAHVCRYYAAVFGGADSVAQELRTLAEGFSRPSSAEDMLRKGRDYAAQAAERGKESVSQAREKVSGFASSARDRFSSAGAAASAGLQSSRESFKSSTRGAAPEASNAASTATSGSWPSPRDNFGDSRTAAEASDVAGVATSASWRSPRDNFRDSKTAPEGKNESSWGSSSSWGSDVRKACANTSAKAQSAWGSAPPKSEGAGSWPPPSSSSWPSTAPTSGQSDRCGYAGAPSPWGAPAPAASGNSGGFAGGGSQGGDPWGAPPSSNTSPWGSVRR